MRDLISRESTVIISSGKKVFIKNKGPFRIENTNMPTNISIIINDRVWRLKNSLIVSLIGEHRKCLSPVNIMAFAIISALKERFLVMPSQFLWFIFFDPRTTVLVSMLQYRIVKRLYAKSQNEKSKLYVTLLLFTGLLNVPIVFYLFIVIPVFFGVPFLLFFKHYIGLVYIGSYLISLNWFPRMVGRVILVFTIYRKFDSQALNFIETSNYVRQRYSREMLTDFYIVVRAMHKIHQKNI